jgi:hypothetical protein
MVNGLMEADMAIKVLNTKTNKEYFLLGTGYGMSQSARANLLGGDLFPNIEEDYAQKITVCDEFGRIIWFDSSDIRVISIDGEALEIEKSDSNDILELCPACGYKIGKDDNACPDCELSLR